MERQLRLHLPLHQDEKLGYEWVLLTYLTCSEDNQYNY
jgi:hypothetical protein